MMGAVRGACSFFLGIVASLLIAAPAWADGPPTGSDPPQNFPMGPMPMACSSQPAGASCQNAAIYYLDQARASLGQPAYALPADFTSLSPVEQDLILTDLDRAQYDLPAIPGLTTELDTDAAQGVAVDDDPRSSGQNLASWNSNWAGAFSNMEAAYEGWVYDDGPGSTNLDCTPSDMSGCWGHRHTILWDFSGTGALAMGAAAGLDNSGVQGYAMLVGMGDSSYVPTYTFTWSAAQADGAGSHTYSPGTPQMTVEIEMDGEPGTVSDGQGQTCSSGTCDFLEPLGQPVTLTATPAAGSVFSEWFGSCSGSGVCTITPEQSWTGIGAFFTSVGSGGSSGSGGGGASGSGGSSGFAGSSGLGGSSGSGGQTGIPGAAATLRISRLTTSRATIHVALRGSHLVCTLSRRAGRRWERLHASSCGASVTYRHLTAGQYRLTVTSHTSSASRIVILRHGVSPSPPKH